MSAVDEEQIYTGKKSPFNINFKDQNRADHLFVQNQGFHPPPNRDVLYDRNKLHPNLEVPYDPTKLQTNRDDVLHPNAASSKITFAPRVRVLYNNSRENTPASKRYDTNETIQEETVENGVVKPQTPKRPQFDYTILSPRRIAESIVYYDCLFNLMIACGIVLILFVILVPVCTIVLTVILGGEGLQVPGYLAPFVFVGIIVCVFLARSELRINRFWLFIGMAILSAISILISLALMIVSIIGLNRDAPDPFGVSSGLHPDLMAILAMECVVVASGLITLIISCIELGIAIHFARGVHAYYKAAESGTLLTDGSKSSNGRADKHDGSGVHGGGVGGIAMVGVSMAPSPPPTPGPRTPLNARSNTPVYSSGSPAQSRPASQSGRPGSQSGRPGSQSGRPGPSSERRSSSTNRPGSQPASRRSSTTSLRPGSRLWYDTPRTSRTPSQTSVNQIQIAPDDTESLPGYEDSLPPGSPSRRWSKTKNVLRAIMDLKQRSDSVSSFGYDSS